MASRAVASMPDSHGSLRIDFEPTPWNDGDRMISTCTFQTNRIKQKKKASKSQTKVCLRRSAAIVLDTWRVEGPYISFVEQNEIRAYLPRAHSVSITDPIFLREAGLGQAVASDVLPTMFRFEIELKYCRSRNINMHREPLGVHR